MNIKHNLIAVAISASLLALYGTAAHAAPGGGFGGGPQGQQQQGGQQQGGQQQGSQQQGSNQENIFGGSSQENTQQQGNEQQGGQQQGGQQQGPSGQGGQGAPDAAAILERMDYDDDGSVTVDDIVNHSLERADKHFERMDADEDGILTEDEFSAKKSNQQPDSSIDHDELKQCIETATGITLKERPTPEEAFAAADENGDDEVTLDEFLAERTAHAETRFYELDTDADNVISEEEIETDLAVRETIKEAHQNCMSEQLLLDESSNNI